MVLIELREHRRDLSLAVRVVQCRVERLRRDAQAGRRVAIDREACLQPVVLLVAGDVPQDRQGLQPRDEPGNPGSKFLRIGILEAVLVLRPADAILDGEVLYRLHEERDVRSL